MHSERIIEVVRIVTDTAARCVSVKTATDPGGRWYGLQARRVADADGRVVTVAEGMRLRVTVSDDEDESILTAVVVSMPGEHAPDPAARRSRPIPATPTLRGEDAARVQRELEPGYRMPPEQLERLREDRASARAHVFVDQFGLLRRPGANGAPCDFCRAAIAEETAAMEALEAASVNALRAIHEAHMG